LEIREETKEIVKAYNLLDTNPKKAVKLLEELGWTVESWKLSDSRQWIPEKL